MSEDFDRTVSKASERRGKGRPPEARISVVFPRGLAQRIPLKGSRVVIGRVAAEAVIGLGDSTVSRSHLSIEFDAKQRRYLATDLGSHNGSVVNGAALSEGQSVVLEDNAVLEVGDVLLVFEATVGPSDPDSANSPLPGSAARMVELRSLIARAAADPSPMLVVGETGTGKEWIAREIHSQSGRRGKLVAVNCAAFSTQLIESQLFGHVKGAFTGAGSDHAGFFAEANGGTLFLDELGELPIGLQPKLLRVLQDGEVRAVGSSQTRTVDVRVVGATNRDLVEEIGARRFRRDLFARLAMWEVRVPALRERRVDILDWIDRLTVSWLNERGIQSGDKRMVEPEFSAEAASALLLHPWRDNLREVDRLVHVLSATDDERSGLITRADLPEWIEEFESSPSIEAARTTAKGISSSAHGARSAKRPVPSKEEFEAAVAEVKGNVSALAKKFGRDRRQIYRWLEAFGLSDKRQGRS